MNYAQPGSLSQALSLLSDHQWTIVAGGTDYYPALGERTDSRRIMDIASVDGLREITVDGRYLRIGALASWTDLIEADLPPAFDCLKLAAREVGSVQIQNRATVVGNICNASPAADGVPPLLTLSAEVELVSTSGGRRQLPLEAFILGNRQTARKDNELVSAILIPDHATAGESSFLKLGSRKYLVISIVMVAARLQCDEKKVIQTAAISVGACSVVAKRMAALESALVGHTAGSDLSDLVLPQHVTELSPIDDVRADTSYRQLASVELLKRVITEAGSKLR